MVDKDSNNTLLLYVSKCFYFIEKLNLFFKTKICLSIRMAGLGAWGLKIFYAATSDRNTFKLANLAIFATGALNCLWIVYDLQERNGLNECRQLIAWASLSK